MSLPSLLVSVVPCYDGSYIGYLLVQMIALANYAWYAVSGFALADPATFIVYLSIVYWEEILLNYSLYGFFTFGFSAKELLALNVMCSDNALNVPVPSLPIQLTWTLTWFTLLHSLLERQRQQTDRWPQNRAIFAYIIGLNILMPFALFYTENASFLQMALAALLAVFTSVRRVLFFEFYFNPFWTVFVRMWREKIPQKLTRLWNENP